ncbi:Pimeloyl-ACP methyl ester carboxylesterase [Streptoalloteichus tenebrarius]|uniref:Pimeloyl-ACP methyl ester carboxylesterase n=1 Tax=Streptoalloteichus tenebrarius (strain ATCC 17920 / DSM 40477 / JCM 4838 / CBS 697.72 / NBRC 16177 / NCIMB 11028 / NRRL B-12390 / A12253. 1 / ISP 5477) TaxID=1933 RepID=A0ABT1I179_STRSD|nr:alpha/beta fold hydrolase [Streptoalloteichus tenebrarius]MCP2261505.1 Pimeloyl-ACP methyl ester carboxylesterase [Streptoalloteichus tenebrarius]BFE99335.1 alpha/beta hydrolase [Streptoalloteichus tenebrarius]
MPTVDVRVSGGTSTVHYLVTGSGPGLVLAHGTGATGETNWAPLIDAVSDRFTIVAPDLSGSGATTDPGGPILVEDLVAQLLGAADHAGLTDFHLAGHSLGAVVATAAAAARPDRVRSLVVHAGWARTDAWMRHQFDLWLRLARADHELLARLLQVTAMGDDTLRARSDADFAAATAGFTASLDGATSGFIRQTEADIAVDITSALPRITAPTLVVASADDRIVPPHHQRELADLIPGAALVEVPGGHGLPFENPDLFTTTIVDHLDRQVMAAAS